MNSHGIDDVLTEEGWMGWLKDHIAWWDTGHA